MYALAVAPALYVAQSDGRSARFTAAQRTSGRRSANRTVALAATRLHSRSPPGAAAQRRKSAWLRSQKARQSRRRHDASAMARVCIPRIPRAGAALHFSSRYSLFLFQV